METTKKEIKKISRKFRTLGSRVMHAHRHEVNSIIIMFIDYIENTPLIMDYIVSRHQEIPSFEEDLLRIENSYGNEMLDIGVTPDYELTYIFQVLKYISKHPKYQTDRIGWGYTSSKSYQDMVDVFGNRVVQPFVTNINDYLMDISTDMGFDEENKFMVTINGGTAQVNISNDSSTLNAQQNNHINLEELEKTINDLRIKLKKMNIEEELQETILANLNVLEDESKKVDPDKKTLKTVASTLLNFVKMVPSLTAATEGVKRIYEITAPLFNQISI